MRVSLAQDENFMESTNADLRKAFSGSHEDDSYLTNIGLEMMKKVGGDERFATAHDSLESGKPVWGPLSKAVDEAAKDPDLNMNVLDQFGNMMLILVGPACGALRATTPLDATHRARAPVCVRGRAFTPARDGTSPALPPLYASSPVTTRRGTR